MESNETNHIPEVIADAYPRMWRCDVLNINSTYGKFGTTPPFTSSEVRKRFDDLWLRVKEKMTNQNQSEVRYWTAYMEIDSFGFDRCSLAGPKALKTGQHLVLKSDYDALKKENEKLLKFKEEMWKLGQAMPPNAISMMIQRELGKL